MLLGDEGDGGGEDVFRDGLDLGFELAELGEAAGCLGVERSREKEERERKGDGEGGFHEGSGFPKSEMNVGVCLGKWMKERFSEKISREVAWLIIGVF